MSFRWLLFAAISFGIATPTLSFARPKSEGKMRIAKGPKKKQSRKNARAKRNERPLNKKSRKKQGLGLGVQGAFGIVQGEIPQIKDTILVYGGDAYYYLTDRITVDGGLLLIDHYETISFDAIVTSVDVDVNLYVLDLNVGGSYHYPLLPWLNLDGGLRFDQLTTTIEVSDDTGLAEQFYPSQETSAMIATVVLGATAKFGLFTVGGQLRQPIYTTSENSDDFDVRFLLATAGLAL